MDDVMTAAQSAPDPAPGPQPGTGLTVRGYHLDVFGHVNNARYLEFLEEARSSTPTSRW